MSVDDQGEIELPNFKFLQETEFPETIVLTISKTGIYQLAGQVIERENLDSILKIIPETTIIHLMADRRSRYSDVDFILEQLQKNNLRDVVLIMENKT